MTSSDQHPALSLDGLAPVQGLVLVVPAELGEAKILRGVVEAVQRVRNTLASQGAVFATAAAQAHTEGNQLRQALCRGQAMAYLNAAGRFDDNLAGALGIPDLTNVPQESTQTQEATTAGTDPQDNAP